MKVKKDFSLNFTCKTSTPLPPPHFYLTLKTKLAFSAFLAKWFLEEFWKIATNSHLFLTIISLKALIESHALHLNNLLSSMTQLCIVPSLVKIVAVVSEKKSKMWKLFKRTDRRTDLQKVTDSQMDKKCQKS